MGQPAAVSGDQVNAACSPHPMPDPATGAPQPARPLPFPAPTTHGASPTGDSAARGGRPAGTLVAGAATVLIGG